MPLRLRLLLPPLLLACLANPVLFGLPPALALNPAPSAASPSDRGSKETGTPATIDRLRDENRTLEAEVKLAVVPQVYLLLDLAKRSLQFKSRGIELHRIEISSWEAVGASRVDPPHGVFRLRMRPAVERPIVVPEPGKDPDTEPIDLSDMPAEYVLIFDPGLTLTVAPPAGSHPWLWVRGRIREGWLRLKSRLVWRNDSLVTPPVTFLRLTLSKEESRSLAWSLTDGMPLLIGATSAP
jgi:hypothetical protein